MRIKAANLEKIYLSYLFDNTYIENEKWYHMKFYSQHGRFWGDISKHHDELYNIVQATSEVHVENLRACAKGREKHACLQIEWMSMI